MTTRHRQTGCTASRAASDRLVRPVQSGTLDEYLASYFSKIQTPRLAGKCRQIPGLSALLTMHQS